MSGKSREFYFEEGKIKIVQKREQIRDNKNYSIVELMLLFLVVNSAPLDGSQSERSIVSRDPR